MHSDTGRQRGEDRLNLEIAHGMLQSDQLIRQDHQSGREIVCDVPLGGDSPVDTAAAGARLLLALPLPRCVEWLLLSVLLLILTFRLSLSWFLCSSLTAAVLPQITHVLSNGTFSCRAASTSPRTGSASTATSSAGRRW